jgi:peptidoglycan/LPS O-acetylase OafA/YrhL
MANISMHRFVELDGLRGVAIILVLFFHSFSRWSEIIPGVAINFWLFNSGWIGVYIFFLISGYVISLKSIRDFKFEKFIFKRYARLFPAMLLCSLLIYASSFWLPNRPNKINDIYDLIPGLVFLQPEIINKIFKLNINSIEGGFWSLFVEVKFYLIFGFLSIFGISKMWWMLTVIVFAYPLFVFFGSNELVLFKIYKYLSMHLFFWFYAGVGFSLYKNYSKTGYFLYLPLILFLINIFMIENDLLRILSLSFAYLVFNASLTFDFAKNILKNKLFQFFGFISYPFYLMHENFIVSFSIKYSHHIGYFSVLFSVAIVILISYLIARFWEPTAIKSLRKLI